MEVWQNPFDILGATPRDDRRRLASLAQDAALLVGETEAQAAYTALLNPQSRLKAEIRWAGGGENALSALGRKVKAFEKENLKKLGAMEAADQIETLCASFDAADAETASEIINAARRSAGILSVTEAEVNQELGDYARELAQDAAKQIQKLGQVLSLLAKRCQAAGKGNLAFSRLLMELASEYEIRVAAKMTQEREGVTAQVKQLSSEKLQWLPKEMDKLCRHIVHWNDLVLPLRRLSIARGMRHMPSLECFWEARGVLERLYNNLHNAEVSFRLVEQLKYCFSDMEELQETIASDLKIIGTRRQINEARNRANNDSIKRSGLSLAAILVVMVLFNLFTGGYVEKEEKVTSPSIDSFITEMDRYEQDVRAHQEALASIYRRQLPALSQEMEQRKQQMEETLERYNEHPTPVTMALYQKLEASLKELEEKYAQTEKRVAMYSPAETQNPLDFLYKPVQD